ncbi:hypothetical protein [Longispora albida]|uniref:hypothetical protein n=1 Tax=Longispora albida TaxID=203523 RepID=UPI0003A80917|nr:hypothetical protein [Longispora albida]
MTGPTPAVRRLLALPVSERHSALEALLVTEVDPAAPDIGPRLVELFGRPAEPSGMDTTADLMAYLAAGPLRDLFAEPVVPAPVRRPALWDVVMRSVVQL